MEITNQKSFFVRTVSNMVAGIAATVVFWLLAALGLAVASGIGALILWPFQEMMVGMPIDVMKGQLVTVALIGCALYMVFGGDYKEFGLLGVLGKLVALVVLAIIALSVDFESRFPGIGSWIAENCSTFPWFGILMAVVLGVWALATYYSSALSGVVFDYVRNKFGVDGKVFSHFAQSADKNKTIFRLPGLWSVVALVLLFIYASINVALDPQLAQRADEANKEFAVRQEEQKIAQELYEQFGKSTVPAPTIGGNGNGSKDGEISNLFTPQSSKQNGNGNSLDGQQQ